MGSVALSRRFRKVVGYPPLSEMGREQRRAFHEALLEADAFEDLPGQVAGGDLEGGEPPAEAASRREQLGIARRARRRRPG